MDGYITIGTELDTKNFDQQIEDVSNKLQDIEDQLSRPKELGLSSRDVTEMKVEAEKLSNKLVDLRKKQKDLDNPPNKFIKGLKEASKETEGIIKKVGRWALAIFGIRSAYLFVRQAMSTLSSYDDQLATNVEYIRYLLANALKPIVEYLVNLAYQLLQYLNMITQSWFGINLFASATTEEFMKQKKAMQGTSSSAKELKKTLAGFDEMNILQEDGSTKVGGGGGGVEVPTPKFEDVKMPKWMQWIIDNKDKLIGAITGIATAIGLYKGATLLKEGGLLENIPLDKIAGIAVIAGGLAYTITNIIEYLDDPSWASFGETIEGIGLSVVGLGITFASVVTGMVGAVIMLWGVIIKYWTEIKTFIEGIYNWFEERIADVESVFDKETANIYRIIVKSGRDVLELFTGVIKNLRRIFDGIIEFFTGIFKGDWQKSWNGLANIVIGIFNILVINIKGVLSNIGSIISIWVNGVVGAIKFIINMAITAIEELLNWPINMLNGFVNTLSYFGINMSYLPYLHLPRLAKGGIVNMPGRGVMVGNAIAGERGQEAVLPLTDSQQMELLGETIGKYITINANITNTMNGRVISRELQRINNESDFSFNR